MLFRTTLLKAFLSSPVACESSVLNRIAKVEKMTGPEAEADLQVLQRLLSQTRRVTEFGKLEKLFDLLYQMGYGGRKPERVVVFSERIETLKFLKQRISQRYDLKDEQVGLFYGTLDDQKQQAMVKDFGTENGKVRILLGSDAASEGINLHYYCHRMVHFDIPWSLITLEQRNGRIDRFGQEHTPDIRYLLTVPQDPELRGDLRILDRLVEKEDNAHKNLGDVAWLMDLHQAELEEERIAQAIQEKEDPTVVLPDEPDEDLDFFAQFLEDEAVEEEQVETTEAVTLFADDLEYAREAFEELGLEGVEWHDHLQGFTLDPPEDLRIRYRYLPTELRRQGQDVKLSIDRDFIQKCLVDSRQDEERWPEGELFWNQHPLAEWLNDKVLANFQRHEAPVIRMKGLGTPLFIFQGVVSNLRSQPVLIRWFGVRGEAIVDMEELHRLLLPSLVNSGEDFDGQALSNDLPRVIHIARSYVETERQRRGQELLQKLKPEERRVQAWIKKKQAQFLALTDGTSLRPDERRRLEREKNDVERRVKAREKWFKEGISTSPNVYLRVVGVFKCALIASENHRVHGDAKRRPSAFPKQRCASSDPGGRQPP